MTPFLFIFNIGIFLYTFFCTIVGFFYKVPRPLLKEELYWPVIFSCLLGAFLYREKKSILSFSLIDFCKKNVDVFLVLILVLILRILLMDQVEIWLDEDYQAYSSIMNRPLVAGVWQHQPPLDMVFTKIGTLLSGESVWGIRMHSVLFSSFASALLYEQIKKFSNSILIAGLSTLFFTFQMIVTRYGYEARPISLGLFGCISFLGLCLSLLTEKGKSFFSETPIFNCLVTFFFLNSLGMQPVILFAAALGFFVLYFVNQNFWFKKHLLSLISGSILFLPIQIYILKYSPPRLTKHSGFSLSSFFEELVRYENFSIVKSYFWPLGYVFIVFCLVFFAFQIFKRRALPLAILFLFTLATLFPLFLVPFFKSHVAWRMNIQYFVLILPVVFFALALMLRLIADHLNIKILFKNMLVITFFAASSFAYDWGPLTHLEKTYEQIEFRRAYKILNEQSTDRDLDLVFCLNTTSWCPDNFILQSFHYKKSLGGIAYGWENPVFNNYLNALKGAVVPDNIYFIYYSIWSGKQLPEPTPYRIEHLRGLDLFKVPVQKQNLAQTMIDFCKPWVDQGLAENELYVAPVEFIVASASSLGQIKLKNYYLQLYKDFKGPKVNSVYLNKLLQEP